jgi:hypothetical protein
MVHKQWGAGRAGLQAEGGDRDGMMVHKRWYINNGELGAQECKLKAVTEMVRCFAEIVEGTLRLSDINDDESLKAVAALYHSKASGANPLDPFSRSPFKIPF